MTDLRTLITPLRVIFVVAAILVMSWATYAYAEARSARVDRHTIRDHRIPESLDGTILVFAADIHAGPLFGEARVKTLIDNINAEQPDVVILGGDYVGGRSGGAAHFYPQIGSLEAPLGVFAVLGNHDAWEGSNHAREGFGDTGITLLENDVARIEAEDGTLVIAGLDDEWTGSPDATTAAQAIGPDDFAILVAHNPDSFDAPLDATDNRWALALAGHTHGGQVRGVYEFMVHKPTRYGQRFLSGWTAENGTSILVSNGVGTVTVPLRSLAPAQIHVITLERETP